MSASSLIGAPKTAVGAPALLADLDVVEANIGGLSGDLPHQRCRLAASHDSDAGKSALVAARRSQLIGSITSGHAHETRFVVAQAA
jgi:hypothetical protein